MIRTFPSIKLRITVLCIVISTISSFVMLCGYYVLIRHNLLESTKEENMGTLDIIMLQMENNIEGLFTLTEACASDPDILRFLETDASPSYTSLPMNMIGYLALNQKYLQSSISKYINKIIVCSNDSRTIMTGNYAGNLKDIETIQSLSKYEDFISTRQRYLQYTNDDKTFFSPIERSSLYYIYPIIDLSSKHYLGYLYISVSPKILTDILDLYPSLELDNLFICIHDTLFQYIDQQFITCPSVSFTIQQENSPVSHMTLTDNFRDSISVTSSNNQLFIYQILPEMDILMHQKNFFLYYIFLPILFILFLFISMYLFLHKWIAVPLANTMHHIDEISEKKLIIHPELETKDDFGKIEKHINQMVVSIDQLIQEQRLLENNILQNQINPHFIYNSLGTLKTMADMQNVPSISEMIEALADIFKMLFQSTAQTIPLSCELEFIDKFVTIQKYRYEDAFQFSVHITDYNLLKVPILKLSLQPILENAIFHGINSEKREIKISLSVHTSEEALIIHVLDNGVGMTQAQIEASLQQNSNSDNFLKKVGICNVNSRIQLAYGDQYGVSISSIPGKYTDVEVRYPLSERS